MIPCYNKELIGIARTKSAFCDSIGKNIISNQYLFPKNTTQ